MDDENLYNEKRTALFIKGEYYCVLVKPEHMDKLFKSKALKGLHKLQYSDKQSLDYFDKPFSKKEKKLLSQVNNKKE